MEVNDILVQVFTYLDLYELIPCKEVCKRWKQLSLSDILWKTILSLKNDNANSLPYSTALPKEFPSYYEYYKHIVTQLHHHEHSQTTIYYLSEEQCPLYLRDENLLEVDYIAECDLEEVNSAIQVIIPHCPNIKRGDLVIYSDIELGVFIYNGNEMEILDYNSDPDAKGVIPRNYSIPDEFPINYWSEYGYWNKLPFHPEVYIDSLLENYVCIEGEYDYTWFECNYMKFCVIIGTNTEESERREVLLTSTYTECEDEHEKFPGCMTLCILED